jgi:NADH dehydrogenase [ubiquinone] 1 alpha subcomplex assembly factor 7
VSPLGEILERRIKAEGPITIADYMSAALSHPEHGYYATRDPFGRRGDFITAPEISQMFGELIGLWCVSVWEAMGRPHRVLLAELGPGRGTLMADALRAVRGVPEFSRAIELHLVETSPVLRQLQAEKLAAFAPIWHDALDDLPNGPLLLVANEFLDALPIHQLVRTEFPLPSREREGPIARRWEGEGAASDMRARAPSPSRASRGPRPLPQGERGIEPRWRERVVTLAEGGGLRFDVADAPATLAAEIPPHLADAPPGSIIEINLGAVATARALAARLARGGGAALFIDYGHVRSACGDTLQAVRDHRRHELLVDPGTADLTAHVNFDRLAATLVAHGAAVHGPVTQGAFLGDLGIEPRAATLLERATPAQAIDISAALRRLIDGDQMGTLFKVLAATEPHLPVPPGFSLVTRR